MKLLLEIETKDSDETKQEIERLLNSLAPNITKSYKWIETDEMDLKWGDRQYYSSNRLSSNGITMDTTKYTNPELTRFECCMCLKVKSVQKLLTDYLGRCKDCQHK